MLICNVSIDMINNTNHLQPHLNWPLPPVHHCDVWYLLPDHQVTPPVLYPPLPSSVPHTAIRRQQLHTRCKFSIKSNETISKCREYLSTLSSFTIF